MSEPLFPTLNDRLLTAIRDLIRSEVPTATFLGLYEYTVTGSTPTTIDCQPTDPTIPLPSLNGIPIGSLSDGGVGQPTTGNRCLIEFLNGDPTRPVVLFNDPPVQTATIDATQEVIIGPSAANPVLIGPGASLQAARVGDQSTCFFPPGVWGPGSILQPPGSVPPISLAGSPAVINTSVSGVITTGNDAVLQ
jgi:hypothetical protein